MVKILSEPAPAGQNGGATRQERNAWLIGLGVDPAVLRGAAATPGGGPQARPASTSYMDYSEAAVEAAVADRPPATAYETPAPDRSDGPPAGGPQSRPAHTSYTDYSEAAVAAAAASGPPATAPVTAYESPVPDRSDEPPASTQARPARTSYTDYSEAAVAAAAADGPPATAAPVTAYESPVPDRSDEPPASPQARPARTSYTDYSAAAVAAAAADGPPATAYASPVPDRSDEPLADGPQARLAVPDSVPVSTPASPSPGLKSRALGDRYRGEEQGKGWQEVRKYKGKPFKTKYYSAEEKQASKVEFGPGGEAAASGSKLDGEFGFVVDPQTGDLHQFPADQVAEGATENLSTHHSSPLAGAPVAGAGIIEAKGGRITAINDRSGHYKPTADLTFQTVRLIDEKAKTGQSPLRDPTTQRETKISLLGKAGAVSDDEYKAAMKEYVEARPRRDNDEITAARGKAAAALSKMTALRQLVGPLGEKAFASLVKDKKKVKQALAEMAKETGKKPTIEELKTFLGKQAVERVKDDDRMIEALSTRYGVKSFKPEDVGTGVEPANFAIGKATEVTLTAEQFLQTGGNEAQIRNKALLGQDIETSRRDKKKALDDQAEADTKPEVAMQIEEKIIAEEKSNLDKLRIELRGVRGTLSTELLANKIKDCENKIAASETKIAELKKSGLSLAPG